MEPVKTFDHLLGAHLIKTLLYCCYSHDIPDQGIESQAPARPGIKYSILQIDLSRSDTSL